MGSSGRRETRPLGTSFLHINDALFLGVFFLFLLATAGVNHHVCLWNPYVISKPVGVSSNFQVIFALSVCGAVFLYTFSVSQNFWVKLGLGSLTDEVRGTGAAPSSTPLPDVKWI